MFQQVLVDRKIATDLEQLGTKRKFWYRNEAGKRQLFKAEERQTGEDWAEKIACELASLLKIPHVHYELAEEIDGDIRTPGVVCENCAPKPRWLVLGNQLLRNHDESYPTQQPRNYKFSQHTIGAVAEALASIGRPSEEWLIGNSINEMESALDVFVAYVMLDALIANQDRHHENWAAIADGSELSLAPTFDHGASLARNISDDERSDRLSTKDSGRQILHFCGKARSAFYQSVGDNRALGTLETFTEFAARANSKSVDFWLEKLKNLKINDVYNVLQKVPGFRMSKISKEFTLELIKTNQKRILESQP